MPAPLDLTDLTGHVGLSNFSIFIFEIYKRRAEFLNLPIAQTHCAAVLSLEGGPSGKNVLRIQEVRNC